MVEVTPINVFTFPGDAAVDLASLVRGPDGAPYVLDAGTATVYRIDLTERTAVAIYRDGTEAAGSTRSHGADGGRDLP